MRRISIFTFCVLGTSSLIRASELPPALELRYSSHKITVPQRDADGPHDYFSDSCGGSIDRTTVHAVIRRKDTLYVVYSCAGWSRGPEARGGRCGSGWEHQMNWIAITGDHVASFRQMDIESCWHDTFGSIDG